MFYFKSWYECNCLVEYEYEIFKILEEFINSVEMLIFEFGIKEENLEKEKENKKEYCIVIFKMR